MKDHYNVYTHDVLLVIEVLVEKFDFFEISESSIYLRDLLKKKHYPALIFDLRRVKIIDSSVFGFLIEIRNKIKQNGYDIILVSEESYILHIMDMMKVPQIMKVVPRLEEAFACFDAGETNPG